MVALQAWPTVNTKATQDRWSQMSSRWWLDGVLVSPDTNEGRPYGDTSGMTVKIESLEAMLRGFFAYLPSLTPLAIATADAALDRVDRVVLRLDTSGSSATVNLIVVTGVAQNNPVAPSLVRSGTTYDIPIATVAVPHGANSIRPQDVTDERIFSTPRTQEQVGVMKMVYGSVAPPGTLAMKGQTVNTADYPALARYWGLQGFATMVIPDMTDLVPRGIKTNGTPGAISGSNTLFLNTGNLPSHSHGFSLVWSGGNHAHTADQPPHHHGPETAGTGLSWLIGSANAEQHYLPAIGHGDSTNNVQATYSPMYDADPPITVAASGVLSGTVSGTISNTGNGDPIDLTPRNRQVLFVVTAY